ncbi:MAG: transposase [Flavonifractor plautii]|uniref:transposase n=1 Tax=uncultured Flavonifractor sp. TaxID=1193534 RepID=UPI00259ADA0E|nr:transposase [uncultured Flavonifractor sp.]MDU6200115.1 transposase [Flavonifractor plautii]MDU6289399.1 transposase [Flavonifractor plautii]MDU6341941.1 transposase [Flavonifractor plautii]
MTPDRPERKNPRLRGWDYGAGGTYFVTFCTSAHRPVLSSIRRGDPCGRPPLVLTPLGECVAEAIALTGVRVEHQVIMPNHVHLLLTLERAATRAAPTGAGTQADARVSPTGRGTQADARVAPTGRGTQADARVAPTGRGTQADARVSPTDRGTQAAARVAPTGRGMQAAAELGRLIGAVKSRSVHLAAGRGLKAGRLWQRGYYDHIVRSENDFLRIWTYIDNNPLRWELDRYYTER